MEGAAKGRSIIAGSLAVKRVGRIGEIADAAADIQGITQALGRAVGAADGPFSVAEGPVVTGTVVLDDAGGEVHGKGATPLAIGRPLDLCGSAGTLGRTDPRDNLVCTRVLHTVAGEIGEVVIQHLGHPVVIVILADAGVYAGVGHHLVPSLVVVRGGILVGVADDGIIGIALLGFGKAFQDFGRIVLAVLVTAFTLLAQLHQPTGLHQIAHFQPFAGIAAVPAVTGSQRLGAGFLRFGEEFDGLLDFADTTHEHLVAGIVLGCYGSAEGFFIRNLTKEVHHLHESESTHEFGGTGIVVCTCLHSFVVHILQVGSARDEEPLLGIVASVGGTHIPVHGSCRLIVAGGQHLGVIGGVAAGNLPGMLQIELAERQAVIILRAGCRGGIRVIVDVQPLVARGGKCRNSKQNKQRFEYVFHRLVLLKS